MTQQLRIALIVFSGIWLEFSGGNLGLIGSRPQMFCDTEFTQGVHRQATHPILGFHTLDWKIQVFGVYTLTGQLPAHIRLIKPASRDPTRPELISGEFVANANLRELSIEQDSPFQQLFRHAMSMNPFDCVECDLLVTINVSNANNSNTQNLWIQDVRLDGAALNANNNTIRSKGERIELSLSREQMELTFSHLGVKGNVLNTILGDQLTIIFKP